LRIALLLRIRGNERHVRLVVRRAASRTETIKIVLDVPVAKEADLVPTLAWAKVPIGDIHIFHAERTTCMDRDKTTRDQGKSQLSLVLNTED